MFSLYLIRHGEFFQDFLTPMGVEQVRLACERFKRAWDGGKTEIFHSPTGRTKASSVVVSKHLGMLSTESDLLSIEHSNDTEKHRTFANQVAQKGIKHLILVGHDETTRVCEAIIFRTVRRMAIYDKEVPHGGLLRYTEKNGYELI
jgi:broad specificity phosphatase PhoE